MDKSNDLLATCFTLGHLLEAADKCAKRVSWKNQVQRFMADRLCQCAQLRSEVLSGEWTPKQTKSFTLMERGKIRRVSPVNMRDRVVERCLCDHVLSPFIRKTAIKDSSACLKGRGPLYARERVKAHLERAQPGAWVFQYDFHDYFHTIDRHRLLRLVGEHVDECFIPLIWKSIGGEGHGLELGSHVCQLLAMWYPTDLDRLMLSTSGLVGYHRYMDDGIAIYDSQTNAFAAMTLFTYEAEARGYEMNPTKTHCNRATHPIVFCKEKYVKRATSVRVTIRKPQTHRNIRHVRRVVKAAEKAGIDLVPLKASCGGYLDRADNKMSRLLDERVTWPQS